MVITPSYNSQLSSAIMNLYDKARMYPMQKREIYKTIVELSEYLLPTDVEAKNVVNIVKEDLERNKKSIKSINGVVCDNVHIHLDLTHLKEEKDRKEVRRLYYREVLKQVKRMNYDIGINASDDEKIKWIYNYLIDIPFDFSYARYKRNGKIEPTLAPQTYIAGYPNYPINMYSEEIILLTEKPKAVCRAFGHLFRDLCVFADLKNTYCGFIDGKHFGEGHEWNVIYKPNGIYMCDTSNLWENKNDKYSQFMIPYERFKRDFKSYKTDSELQHVLHLDKKLNRDNDNGVRIIRMTHRR